MAKKSHLKNIQFILLTIGLFVVAIPVLVFLPAAANFTQGHILVEANSLPGENSTPPDLIQKPPQINIESQNITPPSFTAPSVIAEDFDSGTILYQKNIYNKMLPASTTKIMTAL